MTGGPPRVCILGAGRLGEAVIAALLGRGHPPELLRASTGTTGHAAGVAQRHGIVALTDNAAAAAHADIVLLTVRPPQADAVLARAWPTTAPGAVLLSFVAGRPLAGLTPAPPAVTGRPAAFRVAANTASVGRAGLLAVSRAPWASAVCADRAGAVLDLLGRVVEIPEQLQDTAAATLGSGAAFLTLVGAAVRDAAMEAGVAGPTATAFAVDALSSAAVLLSGSDGTRGPSAWHGLATPGGITEAGLAALLEAGVPDGVAGAVAAAVTRARRTAEPEQPEPQTMDDPDAGASSQ